MYVTHALEISADSQAANELIISLRKDLAAQRKLAAESDALSTKLAATTKSVAEQQTNLSKLVASLAESQSENKSLQARLAASRVTSSADSSLGASRGPGSALKGRGQPSRMTTEAAAAAARTAQLKEEMYSDLTGLILRGVDRKEDADVYDCIQTGRNGSTFPLEHVDFLLTTQLSSSLPSRRRKLVRAEYQSSSHRLRGRSVYLYATLGHGSGRRTVGYTAGLSHRGNHLQQIECGQVLFSRRRLLDEEERGVILGFG